MPSLAACMQFKYFSCHYTTGSTLLTWKGPIHKGRGMGTISYFVQAWPADWVSQHCRTNHNAGKALEPFGTCQGWDREWWRGGGEGDPFGAGREPRLFFSFKKRYPTFDPRENEISIKTGDTGNFVSPWFLLLWLQGRAQESGVTRFQAKTRKKRIPSKDFFYCLLKNKYL